MPVLAVLGSSSEVGLYTNLWEFLMPVVACYPTATKFAISFLKEDLITEGLDTCSSRGLSCTCS